MSLPSKDLEELREDVDRYEQQVAQSGSREEALELAIRAAEISMRALNLVSDPNEKVKYSTRAKQLMRQAEQIKQSGEWRRSAPRIPVQPPLRTEQARLLKEPVNSRKLPTSEKILLLKASYLNGVKFPPWEGPPSDSEFERRPGEALFTDEHSELPLSEFQAEVLDDWKRPIDALPPPSWFPEDRTNLGPVVEHVGEVDLVQDAATDCSVVASLCAAVARVKRGHPLIFQTCMSPFDREKQLPKISMNGKYIACMNFNGCFRKVVIDDRIPTSNKNRVIHVVDRNNPGLLWPPLIEKAYLKVRGGYDFPGSNSGTDIWILTGWIPEQVFLQDSDLDLDRFWKRIVKGFSYGDVLVTMGTGQISKKTERALGLAGEHDYAVLDLREVDGQRLMLVKNPWMEGSSWHGRFKGVARAQNRTGEENLIELDDEPVESPRDLLNVDDQLRPGTFWMDIDNVVQHFESIFLNWNTGLFSVREDAHFTWDLSESEDPNVSRKNRGAYASLQNVPQFTVTASRGGTIWVLLWRHFQNYVPEDATQEEIESGRNFIDLSGYIALAVFDSIGRKVVLAERCLQKGFFVDSPQTLLKLEDCEPNKVYTIVPLEQDLHATQHNFTVSAFSNSPFTLSDATPRYPYEKRVAGAWTKETGGGTSQSPTYFDNPQYTIHVPQKTSMSMLLETSDVKLNVHVKLLHSNGQRLHRMGQKDIIVDSKEYRPSCCLAEVEELEAGNYTIICSTFEPQQVGTFTLRIDSSQPIAVQQLPREGAGRIRTELSIVNFKRGESKVAAPFSPLRLMNFYAIVKHRDQQERFLPQTQQRSNHSHIRLSVELGRGPDRHVVTASNGGDYADSSGLVRTEPVDLGPNFRRYGHRDCWLVLDRMYVSEETREERFAVELFVDRPDAVEVGVWRAWED
ncbi:related to Calpain-like protease palB/RIM13 [Ramularia collo-cygni]|uniref:Related to Calpain-like protease palB/RIM13 n=1 Tax=Ramularia collo-cygni TaxID=112498 RepID=A0A2D3UWE3_9PEZI|nr:related to Calpain-like protease palB/RIM13 [Ramularia collo-cygni]CZT15376.1 related to Calpain-like protease palB/RIM13 [Ramularia collo-cygni]